MKKLSFSLSTLILGFILHFIFSRYLSIDGSGPHLLLLFVVAMGFLGGPWGAQTMGFFWGMAVDSVGIGFFGLQSLLLALAGYISGNLRKRVASERPTAQLAVGFFSSFYFFGGTALVKYILVKDTQMTSIIPLLISTIYDVLLVTVVFWVTSWWLKYWHVLGEKIS